MTKEERNNLFQKAPSYIREFILSPLLAEKTLALYKNLDLSEEECAQTSGNILEAILVVPTGGRNAFTQQLNTTPLSTEKKNQVIAFGLKEIFTALENKASEAAKTSTTIDHDINIEWYNKERAEILREIEGPHKTPALTPQAQAPLPSSPTPKPVSTPSTPAITPKSAFASALTPATSSPAQKTPTIFSMPRTATVIADQPKQINQAPAGINKTAASTPQKGGSDPYREPPVA